MIGRVTVEHKASYEVVADEVMYRASVRGHFHELSHNAFPKVGDVVTIEVTGPDKAVITDITPRHGVLTRITSEGDEQVMVVNVDTVFIVMGLDHDFNVRRLERYLALASQAGVEAVVVLNKADVTKSIEAQLAAVTQVAGDAPVVVLSAKTKQGIEVLSRFLIPGQTVVLLGSSGAGKSTLTNVLLGTDEQAVGPLREHDGRGKHTTRVRQLFELPSGTYLIDTPGIRELGVRTAAEEIEEVFPDIAALAAQCRFNDCDHEKSAGCAVQAALEHGAVSKERVQSYLKLRRGDERIRYQRYRS